MSRDQRKWSAPGGPWRGDGIAIVGIAGRFPQAKSVQEFWSNLCEGRDCITRLTDEDLQAGGVDPALIANDRFVRAGAVLDDIDLFDPGFFGISPREAESMDPQQRLFLEVVQHALDDAGVDPQRVAGTIGVYAGARLSGYWLRLMADPKFMATLGWHQVAAGNDKDFLPAQASFRFDLRGPSVNVQSACSTSMLALSLACDALVTGQCDVALAGAASIAVPHRTGYLYQPGGIASSDGVCRPFDVKADGSVLGNGVAVVVLKRIDAALTASDRIYAVIRGIAINNDGHRKTSFSAPSVQGQADVVARAIANAGVSPSDLGYIEAHGTATSLGDPIEIAALARVFADVKRSAACGIGSVKGNVGHLDPAAGITSLIKVALSLHHAEIPASIHFETPNPAIDFPGAGLRVVATREGWPRSAVPRRAGVSAFGIGGTNVHAILEEAPEEWGLSGEPAEQLLVLSAKSPGALQIMEAELAAALLATPDRGLRDVAYTLALGRREFANRRALVASSAGDAAAQLRTPSSPGGPVPMPERNVVLLFPGQGGQHVGMGRELYRDQPEFRAAIDAVFAVAETECRIDLRALLLAHATQHDVTLDVQRTDIAQPLIFAIGYACGRMWMDWGVRPTALLGHSVGELVAATLAGVFSLTDAVRLVCARGRFMQLMPGGAMLAVALNADEARDLESNDLRISAFNAPRQHTVSGSCAAIDALALLLRDRRVEHHRLVTSHAFHHPMMTNAATELRDVLASISRHPARIPCLSGVTGRWLQLEEATSVGYWADAVVAPVRFSDAVRSLTDTAGSDGVCTSSAPSVFIECGSARTLESLVRAHTTQTDAVFAGSMAARGEAQSDRRVLLRALGTIWQAGIAINWEQVWRHTPARRTTLPPHPFIRTRHWIEAPPPTAPQENASMHRRLSEHCFARTWLPAPLQNTMARDTVGTWIVLIDGSWLGQALCDRLRLAGARVVTVLAGARFQAVSDLMFCVDPQSAESAEQVVAAAEIGDGPVHIVNCWMSCVPPGALTVERGATGVLLSLTAPVNFLQALARARKHPASVHTITCRAFSVITDEPIEPAAAPALGLIRVLPQEIAGARVRLIDVAPVDNSIDARALIEQLVSELISTEAEPVVAYRGGHRLRESFAPVVLPDAAVASSRVRAGGTYLITGGFGGIGGTLARLLATAGKTHLVLVGRQGRAGDNDDSARGVASRRLAEELQRAGATVLALAADIADPTAVRRVIQDVERKFGQIHGVVHAAGVAGGGMFAVRNADTADAILAPKVRGTIALLNALAAHQPDFVVFCSSFAAIGGGIGQGDYCAANAFLDAAAIAARARGIRATTINWPAWREVGMVVAMELPPELEHLRQSSLSSGITPSEGAELFARVLAADVPQVVITPFAPGSLPVAPRDTRRETGANAVRPEHSATPPVASAPGAARLPQRGSTDPTLMPSHFPSVNGAHPSPTSRAATDGDASSNDMAALLDARLTEIWAGVLGVRGIAPSDNFYELGGQSMMALQIVSRVSEQFPIEVTLGEVLENPTLESFGALVWTRLVHGIAAMPDDKVTAELASGGTSGTFR